MGRRLSAKILAFSLGFTLFSYVTNSSLSRGSLSLQPAYAGNGCGPQGSTTGYILTKYFLFPYNDRFKPACDQHDACYNLNVSLQDQAQCDTKFRDELYRICEDRSLWQKLSEDTFGFITNPKIFLLGGIGLSSPCKRQADYAVWAVSKFGSSAVNGAIYSLKVQNVRVQRIDDWWGDDELSVCVTVKNDGNVNTEWDLVLLKKNGDIADTEPDTYERNIAIGSTDSQCVTTNNDPSVSVSDLGNPAKVAVRVDDDPSIAPFRIVASINVPTNLRPYDRYNTVAFNQMSHREAFEGLKQIKAGQ
ncbi:MAG: hypothetical protein AB1589_13175 [Cyanobacteriota bacterium]